MRRGNESEFAWPELSDGDLRLRPWRAEDAEALFAAWADPAMALGTTLPKQPTLEYARDWIASTAKRALDGRAIDLVIANRADAVVGEVGAVFAACEVRAAEVGYWIGREFRGRGYAKRALGMFCDWALNDDGLGLERLAARVHRANVASGAVLASQGFVELTELGPEMAVWHRERGHPPIRPNRHEY